MNTPDTEWKKTLKEARGYECFDEEIILYVGEETWGTKELISFIQNLLTSRDTYWKERVEAVRRDLKARMAHEDYTECVTCDETLYHLDTLLDNLK